MKKDMKKDLKCMYCLTLVENGSHFEFENSKNELPGLK